MMSFSQVPNITTLVYAMIGLQEGRHTKRLAQVLLKDT